MHSHFAAICLAFIAAVLSTFPAAQRSAIFATLSTTYCGTDESAQLPARGETISTTKCTSIDKTNVSAFYSTKHFTIYAAILNTNSTTI
jgi:hypothetical protein